MRRWAPLVVALLVLLTLVLLQLRPDYRNTGDPLYDAMARLFLDESERCELPLAERMSRSLGQSLQMNGRDFRVARLLELEPRFGSDPRFAELLFSYRVNEQSGSGELQRVVAAPQTAAAMACLAGNFGVRYEDAALEACRRGLALDPENSLFHYQRALILISLGELEEAQAAASAGNAAPLNAARWPFPLDRMLHEAGEPSPGNARAAGIALSEFGWNTTQFALFEPCVDLQVALLIGWPTQKIDPFVVMLKRIGQMDQQSATAIWSAAQAARILAGDQSVRDGTSALSFNTYFTLNAAQEREAAHIRSELQSIQSELTQLCAQPPGLFPSEPLLLDAVPLQLAGRWDHTGNSGNPRIRLRTRLLGEQLARLDNIRAATGPLFDCLDPPPYGAWSRGELAGTHFLPGPP